MRRGLLLILLTLVLFGMGRCQQYVDEHRARPMPQVNKDGRPRYNWEGVVNNSKFDNIPVDLWFGKHDGQFDTTHLRIASDYLGGTPYYHGGSMDLYVVWPSLRSIDEENEIRTKDGKPELKGNGSTFWIWLSENESSGSFYDKGGYRPIGRCEPMILDSARGVRHCNDTRIDKQLGSHTTWYWLLDESIRTPYFKEAPAIECTIAITDTGKKQLCSSQFSYNADLGIHVVTIDEALAVDLLTHFPKLIQLLQSFEVKP